MTRLIDADALNKEFRDFVRASNNSGITPNWNDAVSLIGSAPTMDVWRCGECRFSRYDEFAKVYRCNRSGLRYRMKDFCSRGKRREE